MIVAVIAIIFYLLIIAVVCGTVLLINYVIANKMSKIAFDKGYGKEAHAFAMVFLLNFIGMGIIGCIYVWALPDKVERAQKDEIIRLLEAKRAEEKLMAESDPTEV